MCRPQVLRPTKASVHLWIPRHQKQEPAEQQRAGLGRETGPMWGRGAAGRNLTPFEVEKQGSAGQANTQRHPLGPGPGRGKGTVRWVRGYLRPRPEKGPTAARASRSTEQAKARAGASSQVQPPTPRSSGSRVKRTPWACSTSANTWHTPACGAESVRCTSPHLGASPNPPGHTAPLPGTTNPCTWEHMHVLVPVHVSGVPAQ